MFSETRFIPSRTRKVFAFVPRPEGSSDFCYRTHLEQRYRNRHWRDNRNGNYGESVSDEAAASYTVWRSSK